MIKSFAHKGLKMLWEQNNHKGVDPQYAKRLRAQLTLLDAAETLADLQNTPGLKLHPLKGNRAGDWSFTAYANYRVTFRWVERGNGDAEAQSVTVEVEPEIQPPEGEYGEAGEVSDGALANSAELEPTLATGDAYRVNLEDYHSGHH